MHATSTAIDFGSIKPTFVVDVPIKKSPKFLFVTISNPEHIKDRRKQSTIRRHAKRNADQAKSKFKNSNPGEKGVKLQVNQSAGLKQYDEQRSKQRVGDIKMPIDFTFYHVRRDETRSKDWTFPSVALLRPLGAGRGLNPFAPYPVKTNSRTIQLLDYLAAKHNESPMAIMWVTIGMSDTSAFYLTLASGALQLAQDSRQDDKEETELTEFYTISVDSVSKRLQDPVDGISEGVIGTILGFACIDKTLGNWERFKLHISGLNDILELRGGIESLRGSRILQETIFWLDVTGALILDITPTFVIPHHATVNQDTYYSPRIFAVSQRWITEFPNLREIANILFALGSLTSYLSGQRATDSIKGPWEKEFLVAHYVHPVAHKILSITHYTIPSNTSTESSALLLCEILRVTSLLFISLLKENYNSLPSGVCENKLRLKKLLSDDDSPWVLFMDLRLWVLTVYALAETLDRSWHVSEISKAMVVLALPTWQGAIKLVKELIWVEKMMDEAANILGDEVTDFQIGLTDIDINASK